MAYQAQLGIPITILHPVRDMNGNFVAGQASAVTATLIKPDRTVDAVTTVTKVDYATGWVQVTVTLPLLGTYTLELTNPDPPTADGGIEPYTFIVGAGVSAAQNLLTSLDRVRTRLQLTKPGSNPPTAIQPGESHPFDSLINLLISEVSEEFQFETGRSFGEASYVEYIDGSGRSSLVLPAGPLVSFSLLETVDYQDNGAGGVTEVRTTVAPHTYVVAGLRSQPRFMGRGRIDLVGGAVFTRGVRNYRASFVAGFAAVPEHVVGFATTDVVYRLMARDVGHLLTQALGDGSTSYLRPQQMQEMRERFYDLWRLEAA
jgi:hypothetical protein